MKILDANPKYDCNELWNFYNSIHSKTEHCRDKCVAIQKYALQKEYKYLAQKYFMLLRTASSDSEKEQIFKLVDNLYENFIDYYVETIYSKTGVKCSKEQFVFT